MPTYWRLAYSDRLRNCLRESLAPNPPDTPMLVASVGSRRTGIAAMEPHPTSPFLLFLYASKAPTSVVSSELAAREHDFGGEVAARSHDRFQRDI